MQNYLYIGNITVDTSDSKVQIGQNHRTIEYPKLEGNHIDHGVQLLPPHRTTQKSGRMSESIVQTLPELQQAQCHDHCPGKHVPVPKHPPSEKHFPIIQTEPPLMQLHTVPLVP